MSIMLLLFMVITDPRNLNLSTIWTSLQVTIACHLLRSIISQINVHYVRFQALICNPG